MTSVSELHDKAMELAQDALVNRDRGQVDEARRQSAEAMELEAEAASQLENDPATEPTRSILYQSAASLATDAGLLDRAERLIAEGLAGTPPPRVRGELRSLWETVSFGIRLRDRGRVGRTGHLEAPCLIFLGLSLSSSWPWVRPWASRSALSLTLWLLTLIPGCGPWGSSHA